MKRQSPAEGSGCTVKAIPWAHQLRERDARLRSMKALMGNLAHSFNNALAPMAGYITLLADEIQTGTPSEQYLNKFECSLHKSEGLITTILQATHPERNFIPKEADLTSLLQRTTEAWLKGLPASAQLSILWDVAPCTAWIDEAQWTRVISHLLRNAELALKPTGTLKISLQPEDLAADDAEALGLEHRAMFQLQFEDNGGGMTEEVLRRACEPLFSTRGYTSTAGLGLTLVHSVVQLHRGQLLLESTPGVGSTVRIWAPRIW